METWKIHIIYEDDFFKIFFPRSFQDLSKSNLFQDLKFTSTLPCLLPHLQQFITMVVMHLFCSNALTFVDFGYDWYFMFALLKLLWEKNDTLSP